jgi:hypothetical protein
VFVAFFGCHMVGDYLLQTDWQARYKTGGLGSDPRARQALASHIAVYTLCFAPALVWIGDEKGLVAALLSAAAIAVPHAIIDDGHLLGRWMISVKKVPEPFPLSLTQSVDQSFHIVCLVALALLVGA